MPGLANDPADLANPDGIDVPEREGTWPGGIVSPYNTLPPSPQPPDQAAESGAVS